MTVLVTRGLGKTGGFLSTSGIGKGILVIVVDEGGGSQFQRLVPISELFDKIVEPIAQIMYLREEPEGGVGDVDLEIDGQPFKLEGYQAPSQFLREAPGVSDAIRQAVDKLGITERKARQQLFDRVIKERKKVEKIKLSVFNDDDEIIAILIATDDL